MGIIERFGASLRRAPWVWFALTLVSLLMLQNVLGVIFALLDRPDRASDAVTWLGVVLITCWFAAALTIAERLVYDRPKWTGSNLGAATRWVVAVVPALGSIAFAAFGRGWVPLVGLVASAALLVVEARTIAATMSQRPN